MESTVEKMTVFSWSCLPCLPVVLFFHFSRTGLGSGTNHVIC